MPSKYTTEDRLFFVVDSVDDNEEIFETLKEAEAWADDIGDISRIRICIVRNTYENKGCWNYNDLSDTFETVKIIKKPK
jgi:hypothetical protein